MSLFLTLYPVVGVFLGSPYMSKYIAHLDFGSSFAMIRLATIGFGKSFWSKEAS